MITNAQINDSVKQYIAFYFDSRQRRAFAHISSNTRAIYKLIECCQGGGRQSSSSSCISNLILTPADKNIYIYIYMMDDHDSVILPSPLNGKWMRELLCINGGTMSLPSTAVIQASGVHAKLVEVSIA